ncbi:MAG: tRNA (adenosine(37)-N6)-threonylcarbamoyltransferase complex ATPase subunit type 1 TsaE [Rhizobiaceae bacterium]
MSQINIICDNEAATIQLAETMALAMRCGDLVTLNGDLGAGKTTLARALIRTASGNPMMEVPSPTFTLVQSYEKLPMGNLAHMDLYRIEDGSELEELGLEEALGNGVVIIEWPQKAKGLLPKPALEIDIQLGTNDDHRQFGVTGTAEAMARFERSLAIRVFLDSNNHEKNTRQYLTGDASSRSYETIHVAGGEADIILMNAPPMSDGAPIKDGKPYSQIAKLAENMRPFVGVGLALEKNGFRSPHIYAQDLEQGFLLIESLGTGTIVTDKRKPIKERYEVALEVLAAVHEQQWNTECKIPGGSSHIIPPFDREAIHIEVELLSDWYAPYCLKTSLSEKDQIEFRSIWDDLIDQLEDAEKSLTLRDYHSPNVIWIGEASGNDRIGVIDFQDALIGPTAYDVASIAQDARVDVSVELEQHLINHYCANRSALDEKKFRKAYAIMAAERATKILGIFVRLSKRDGKHNYLAHLPRIENYLSRSLTHPALARYRGWVENVIRLSAEK